MLLCDISRQLLSHVSATELMRTIHNLGTPVLVEDGWVAQDKMRRAQTREGLSASFWAEFYFCSHFWFVLFWSSAFLSLWWFLFLLFLCVCVCVLQFLFLLSGFGCLFVAWLWCYPLVCPWLCSIDPRIAVLCHGWYRGVALCWCGETSLPWFISFFLLSLFLFYSVSFCFLLWHHILSIHLIYNCIHLTLVFFHVTPFLSFTVI